MSVSEQLPEDLENLLRLAQEAYEQSGPSARVAELLRTYVDVVPDNGLAWFQFGDSLRSIGRYREAEQALLTARGLAPRTHRFAVEARLGMLCSKRDSPRQAEKWFRIATSDSDCPGWVWCLRGANLLRMESIRLARDCLKAALDREDVDREEGLLNLGLAARTVREYDDAARYAKEALEIDPGYSPAKELLDSLEGAKQAQNDANQPVAHGDRGHDSQP